ncbi:MAG: hypothetical protein ACKVOX_08320 [Rhizobacter sp.]
MGLVAATAVLGACGNSDTPQGPTPTAQRVVEVFTGRITPGGSGFYSFQVRASETASYTFASLTQLTTGRALDTVLMLGVGVPAGEDCVVSNSALAAPGLGPQLSASISPGIYCVRLSDPGTLTTTANFAVRIQHP